MIKGQKKKKVIIKLQLTGKYRNPAGRCRVGEEHRDQIETWHAGLGERLGAQAGRDVPSPVIWTVRTTSMSFSGSSAAGT